MKKVFKKRAPSPSYLSPSQLTKDCFQTPFEQQLNPENRWVVLSRLMPWDEVCNLYLKNVGESLTGRPPLSPREIIGSLIIKHLCNLDDRETVDQISENIYMQYFLGYSSFSSEPPFDASLFVDFRKRLGMENLNAINEKIVSLKTRLGSKKDGSGPPSGPQDSISGEPENKGRVIFDATACPQDSGRPVAFCQAQLDFNKPAVGCLSGSEGTVQIDKSPERLSDGLFRCFIFGFCFFTYCP